MLRVIAFSALTLLFLTVAAPSSSSGEGPPGTLYSVRDDGKAHRTIVQPHIPSDTFIRSPGGRSILYDAQVEGVDALFAAELSGANPIRLTPASHRARMYPGTAMSPDGRRIAFSTLETCGTNCLGWGLYVVNRDSTGLRRIAEDGVEPSWAPDSRRLAYAGVNGIKVADTESGSTETIADGPSDAPIWAPRGERIAYGAQRGGYEVACTVNADGSRRRCTERRSFVSLVWSQDARRIAFKQVKPPRLGIMDAYAGHARRFRRTDRRVRPVALSPDGTRLAYAFGVYGTYDDVINVMRVGAPRRAVQRLVREPNTLLTDIRWRGRRISYIGY
jgi:Tol biopolymer transport system component